MCLIEKPAHYSRLLAVAQNYKNLASANSREASQTLEWTQYYQLNVLCPDVRHLAQPL